MSIDRTTKVLLTLILMALCVLLFRQGPAPVLAAPIPGTAAQATTMIYHEGSGTTSELFVVSNGTLSLWYTSQDSQNNPKLTLADSKPLPSPAK